MERMTADDTRFFKGIFYARPGTGKTLLAAGACHHPKMREVLFLDVDQGMATVSHGIPQDLWPYRKELNNIDELEAFFWKFRQGDKEFAGVTTIVLDGGSELFTRTLEGHVRMMVDPVKGGKRKGNSIDAPEPGDYGEAGRKFARILRWLTSVKANVIITAHAEEIYAKPPENDKFRKRADSEKTLMEVTPQFSPMSRKLLLGAVDFVWYMYADAEGVRKILFQPKGVFYAKTRGPSFAKQLGPVMTWEDPEVPLLPTIYDMFLK